MRSERFTEKSQEALQAAATLATERGQQAIEPEHLVLALLRQEGGLTRPLLQAAGADPVALDPALASAVERFPRVTGGAESFLSQPLRKVMARLPLLQRTIQRLVRDPLALKGGELAFEAPAVPARVEVAAPSP
jgi:ATP-dependent Clp protease ATP-binding subunit ClpB